MGDASIDGQARFTLISGQLEPLLEKLRSCPPCTRLAPRLKNMSGIYTFWENERPLYVGRTNTIRERIQSHTRPASGHNSATFAFILAKERAEQQGTLKKMTRGDLEDDAAFAKVFTDAKARVAKMHVRFVLIGDPCTQAIFEVYAAMVLAAPYNDFDNH